MKLVILVDLKLNDDNVKNQDLEDDEINTYPVDCMIGNSPPKSPI
jgi:hypothetical protein